MPITDVHRIAEVWQDGRSANDLRAARRADIAREANAPALVPVTIPADGRIARFSAVDGKAVITAPFGAGWQSSTDSIAGGKSSVALSVEGAAPHGQPALVMSGAITNDFIAPWAGLAFAPAKAAFAPANLSPAKAIRFWVRGQGGAFAVMGFSPATGRMPSVAQIAVAADWREITVRFADLAGFDPSAAQLLLIAANQRAGAFRLEIADVRLVVE